VPELLKRHCGSPNLRCSSSATAIEPSVGAEVGAAVDLGLDRRPDRRVGVADAHHPEPVVEVDVLVAVDVPDPAPRAAVDVDRPRVVFLERGGDAARHRPQRPLVGLGRARGPVAVALLLGLGQLGDPPAVDLHRRRD
jgi:hypothetical protein